MIEEENKDNATNTNATNCNGNGCCKRKAEPRGKLFSYNWLKDVPATYNQFDMIEVQFKNTRKGYFRNTNNLDFAIGDWVAVEANPGHDIGQVTLTGKLVALQIKKANLRPDFEFLRVFRKAKQSDMERYELAKARENDTMIRSRKIAEDLRLKMKIGDVEYQGDGNKAIFYYIADERVDFRQLIKILADTFKIRIEMKQIGARQEAGRIGGIGPCGRPLCCSSWVTSFVSVSTSAARYQDISLNPQKLAGQCAKLKCCLNFEVDTYVEQVKRMPSRDIPLETKDATYYHFKTDILKREITYSTDKHIPANLVTINTKRVAEMIALNKRGVRPERLNMDEPDETTGVKSEFGDIIQQDSLTRFDKNKKRNNNKNRNNNNGNNNNRNRNAGERRQQGGGGENSNEPRQPRQRNNEGKPQQQQQQPNAPKANGEGAANNGNNSNGNGGERKRRFNNNNRRNNNNKARNNQSNETKTPKPTE